jgi:hypothetical protein
MMIRPYNGLMMYEVTSESDPRTEPYHVDLTFYRGIGNCDCAQFQFRLEPHLVRQPFHPDQYRCKHILACREFLGKQLVDTLIKSEIIRDSGANAHLPRLGTMQFQSNSLINTET